MITSFSLEISGALSAGGRGASAAIDWRGRERQATAGTQRTAEAVGELASLATELKGSVAGFKVA